MFAAILLALAAFGSPNSIARGQENGTPEITGIRVGFNGKYKPGLWTPVTILVKGGAQAATGHVQLTVPDGDGLPSRVTSVKPYQVLPGQTIAVMLFTRFGRIENEAHARFVDLRGGETLAERRFNNLQASTEEDFFPAAMFSGQQLIVTVGSSIGVEDVARLHRRDPKETIEPTRIENLEELPTRWFGYDGVDALVLATSRPEIFRKLTTSSDQLQAIDEWVQRGGRLIITAASQAPELVQDGPLARFAPGEFRQLTSISQTADLESYSESQDPIVTRRGGLKMPVAQFGQVRGRIEAPDAKADLPLVIRSPYGLGEVVFVTVDLDQPPFVEWKARGQFVSKLLGLPAAGSDQTREETPGGQVTSTGLTDMSSQLRGALDQFDDIVLVPFWIVAALICVYILLIGPGDYFLVRNVLKRMELTWITFPAIVLLFCGGAYLAASTLKGSRLQVNQVDLIDVVFDSEHPLVRGTTWLNVFSPRAQAYNMTLSPQVPPSHPAAEEEASVLLSWLGLPGQALGGMDPKTTNPPLTDEPYDFSPDLERLIGMPIHVWSTKSLTAQWSIPEPFGLDVLLEKEADDTLRGELTSELDVPLVDCWLAYDRWVYPLEKLAPGETIDLGQRWRDREVLASRLARNRMEYDEQKKQYISVSSPYDRESFDVPMILRSMMFYEASGGVRYTGLLNRYQPTIDLTSQLSLNRAILIGFSDKPGAMLQQSPDGGQTWQPITSPKDKHWTCYRFVIPVKQAKSR